MLWDLAQLGLYKATACDFGLALLRAKFSFPFRAQVWQPHSCHRSSLTPRLAGGAGPLRRWLFTCRSYENTGCEHGAGSSSGTDLALRCPPRDKTSLCGQACAPWGWAPPAAGPCWEPPGCHSTATSSLHVLGASEQNPAALELHGTRLLAFPKAIGSGSIPAAPPGPGCDVESGVIKYVSGQREKHTQRNPPKISSFSLWLKLFSSCCVAGCRCHHTAVQDAGTCAR